MDTWVLAYYCIEAKKNIDSIIYIEDNKKLLSHISLKNRIDTTRNSFYISCCVVVDNVFKNNSKKKELKQENMIINRLFHERDKNSAHKDKNYEEVDYIDIKQIISEMKVQLETVVKVCSSKLPSNLTLTYVSHDRELFRLANGVTATMEQKIENTKYTPKKKNYEYSETSTKQIINHFDELKNIPDNKKGDYVILIRNGINPEEGVQERQDSCILINQFYNENMWVNIDEDIFEIIKEMRKIGIMDRYGIITKEFPKDPVLQNKFLQFTKKYPINQIVEYLNKKNF